MSPSRCAPDPGTPAPSRDLGRPGTGRSGRRRSCGVPLAAPSLRLSEPGGWWRVSGLIDPHRKEHHTMSHKDLNTATAGKPKRIAIVISNPGVSTTTGWPVGFWWAELSHPYFKFTEAGYEVEVFSPQGGPCEADAMSDPEDPSEWQAEDVISRGYKHDPAFLKLIENTKPVDEID